MKPVTDIKDLRALPEREEHDVIEHRQADGRIVKELCFKDFVVVDYDEGAILMFEDTDGRLIKVNYNSRDAFKTEKRL